MREGVGNRMKINIIIIEEVVLQHWKNNSQSLPGVECVNVNV